MLSDSVFDADSNAVDRRSLAAHVLAIIGLEISIFHNFGHFDIIFIAQPCETTKTATASEVLHVHSEIARSFTWCQQILEKKLSKVLIYANYSENAILTTGFFANLPSFGWVASEIDKI